MQNNAIQSKYIFVADLDIFELLSKNLKHTEIH